METNILFEPSGKTSLVASGQTILGAARSLGVEIPIECGGIGKCDSCAVTVEAGADGISDLVESERTYLNEERISAGQRLACQAHLLGPNVTVRVPTAEERAQAKGEENGGGWNPRDPRVKQIREEFDQLPLDRKVAALAEMGVNTAGDVISEVFAATRRIGDELSSMFSGPKSPEQPSEPAPTEEKTESKEEPKD